MSALPSLTLGASARRERLHALSPPSTAPGTFATPAQAPLLERAAELDAIDRAVASVLSGVGASLLIEASAGLGKSALIEYAAQLASGQGFMLRHAAPVPAETELDLGVVRALLEAPVRGAPAAELEGGP